MVSILATCSQFLTLLAVRMKDVSDHVTSLLKPPKGNSPYSQRKPTFSPRPSDLRACLASISSLAPSSIPLFLGFLLQPCWPLRFSQSSQECSHLRPLHWLFPLCFSSTFCKSALKSNFLKKLTPIALFKLQLVSPLSQEPDSSTLLYAFSFHSTYHLRLWN